MKIKGFSFALANCIIAEESFTSFHLVNWTVKIMKDYEANTK